MRPPELTDASRHERGIRNLGRPCVSAPTGAGGYRSVRSLRSRSKRPQAFVTFILEQRVLDSFALSQKRHGLLGDVGLEMRAVLMRLERGFVAEQFVEQELRRIFLRPADQEQPCA